MTKSAAPKSRLGLWLLAASLLLPALSLVPLGGFWLWQNGWVIPWALAALAVTAIAYLLQLRLMRRLKAAPVPPPEMPEDAGEWTGRERDAWNAVLAVADAVEPERLNSREEVLTLGLDTVEAVAKTFHPEQEQPLWQFTVPEALTLLERVSADLRPFVVNNIPLGDRLTVGQVMKIYEWRSAVDMAQKGYDVWRVVRLFNPLTAITSEMRERLSKQFYQWGRDELARRLARGYVKEVGRAAIDLYSGRLLVADHVSQATQRDRAAAPEPAEPLRFLLAGQTNAGKSSLINALSQEVRAAVDVLPATGEFTAYEMKREGVPAALFLDSPGIGGGGEAVAALVEEAASCDAVIWVAGAGRADREADRAGLDALRRSFAARPERSPPPVLLVLSHIDRLRPVQEWAPPYDLSDESLRNRSRYAGRWQRPPPIWGWRRRISCQPASMPAPAYIMWMPSGRRSWRACPRRSACGWCGRWGRCAAASTGPGYGARR